MHAIIDNLYDSENGDNESSERVVLDADIGGSRYLLIKMPTASRNMHGLSPREVEIVRLVAEGRPNKVIAALLDISAWTVCTHLRRIFTKLGVTSRAAMVARASEFASSDVLSAFAKQRFAERDQRPDERPKADSISPAFGAESDKRAVLRAARRAG